MAELNRSATPTYSAMIFSASRQQTVKGEWPERLAE